MNPKAIVTKQYFHGALYNAAKQGSEPWPLALHR